MCYEVLLLYVHCDVYSRSSSAQEDREHSRLVCVDIKHTGDCGSWIGKEDKQASVHVVCITHCLICSSRSLRTDFNCLNHILQPKITQVVTIILGHHNISHEK